MPVERLKVLLDVLQTSPSFELNLSIDGWRKLLGIELPELHDRIVVAVHFMTDSEAILTNDQEIANLDGTRMIW